MRVKEEVVITRLRGLKEGDSMILPSWCKRRDVL
jgi:radical SAM superfamily enzyme